MTTTLYTLEILCNVSHSGMNANDYCSAPPLSIPPPTHSIQSPLLQCI